MFLSSRNSLVLTRRDLPRGLWILYDLDEHQMLECDVVRPHDISDVHTPIMYLSVVLVPQHSVHHPLASELTEQDSASM